jgi:hypothetical protein
METVTEHGVIDVEAWQVSQTGHVIPRTGDSDLENRVDCQILQSNSWRLDEQYIKKLCHHHTSASTLTSITPTSFSRRAH